MLSQTFVPIYPLANFINTIYQKKFVDNNASEDTQHFVFVFLQYLGLNSGSPA
jgi:hypothetical protein